MRILEANAVLLSLKFNTTRPETPEVAKEKSRAFTRHQLDYIGKLEAALADADSRVEALSEQLRVSLGRQGIKYTITPPDILCRSRCVDRRNYRYNGID